MRTILIALIVLGGLSGCMKQKIARLNAAEQSHYYALKVWMDDWEEKAFLKGKTEADRSNWLKEAGYWDRFYKYDSEIRDAIVTGDVKASFTQDQVFMAWGKPHARKRLTGRPATRSELLVYRFEVTRDGETLVWAPGSKETFKAMELYQLELYIDDSVVTEILRKNDWD